MPTIGAFSIRSCFNGCRDRSPVLGLSTRVWNLTDKPVELQVRFGSTLKKGHTLKPGSSKRLKCRNICKQQMPKKSSCGIINGGRREMKSLIYYYDETCHPYVWIHDGMSDFSRVVKQQYISLEDLRDCSEIKIFRDHQRGCVAVRKKPRPDLC
ncbi:hypothetical protein Scep_009320 [Stephania cephalantha]|uniref:Uncharacterized protein n=1 Tax=Stephania cephalantha TaxID=152367 RepID=A0AAP0JTQ2_9MAGN